jgi:hypothetical protein
MDEMLNSHNQHRVPEGVRHGRQSRWDWKRAHRHWGFWAALFLMFAAMIIYVMTDDLSMRPRRLAQQPVAGTVAK